MDAAEFLDGSDVLDVPARVSLDGYEEPPSAGFEAGGAADSLFRFCWYSAEILCEGNVACCSDAARRYEGAREVQLCKDVRQLGCNALRSHAPAFESLGADVRALSRRLVGAALAQRDCDPFDFAFRPSFSGSLRRGEACALADVPFELEDTRCLTGLICRDTCEPPLALDEACESGDCVMNTWCDAGFCGGFRANGATCEVDLACESRRCTDGATRICSRTSGVDQTWCFVE